jgi:hypothetical protein
MTPKEFWIYLTNDDGCAHVVAVIAEECKEFDRQTALVDGHRMRFPGLDIEEIEEAKAETHRLIILGRE